jgi:hypothetical protein
MKHEVRTLAEEFARIAAFKQPRAIALMGDSGEQVLEQAEECAAPFGDTLVINGADYKSDAYQSTNEEKMGAFKTLIEAQKSGAIIINNIHEADDNAIRMARLLIPLVNNRTPLIIFAGPVEQTEDVLFEERKLAERVKPIFIEEKPARPQAGRKPGV